MIAPQEWFSESRNQVVRKRLATIRRRFEATKAEIAELLIEVHEQGYWQGDYPSFRDYVEGEVHLKYRTALELMKVRHVCQKLGISSNAITRLGWSKTGSRRVVIDIGQRKDGSGRCRKQALLRT